MESTIATAGRPPARGRIDKRESILAAAFTVFANRGFARACMEEIAEVAGVAKHTVYNHLGDKESLFREALATVAGDMMAGNLAIVETSLGTDAAADPELALHDAGRQLLHRWCDRRSWALRRLLYAEINQFPDLLDVVWGHGASRLREALADRLARLSLAGHLDTPDPSEAAEQFLALLTGPMEARSHLGTKAVDEQELERVARSAVRTFLMAYGGRG
ncbi:TetR/AcrR family transcriptional regulator [Micromonospora sp. NPDC049175]|uniref:TetR/AcrR family transcriptional regulator n=1 Tax=Micromonospora sp. NPDC049175 TaxID=3364266 RepID=UPI00371CCD3B